MYPSICVWSQISNSWGKQSRPNSATLSRMRASQYSRSFSVWAATLRALLAAPVLGEEGLERGPDVLLALDEDGLEVVRVEAAEDVEHRALVVARAERLDLAVAEEVADLGQLLGGSQCSRIVGIEVVAVRAVEGVDVPQGRVVARLDDLERLQVARRDERPARLALVEELLLGHLARLGVVRDEDDLHVAVLGADELVEEEEETARQVLLHGVHGPGGVHDAHHDGVRLPLHVGHHVAADQIVLVEGEALAGGPERDLGRGLEGGLGVGVAARELPLDALADGAALVEADTDADLAVALALGEPVGLDLAQRLALQVRQLEVLEHDVDQLLQRDVGLVVVGAGLVAGLVLALAGVLRLADHLAGLRLAASLADARGVLAVGELVLADAAEGGLDDLLTVLPDGRRSRDDLRDSLSDRLADLEAVASAVPRRAVAALGAGAFEGPEDGLQGAVHERRAGPTGSAGQSFQRLLAAYFSTTSTQLSQ